MAKRAILNRVCEDIYGSLSYAEIEDVNDEIRQNPGNAEAYAYRAAQYLELGKLEKALADIKKAIDLNTLSAARYHNVKGTIHLKGGDMKKCIAENKKAAEMAPKDKLYAANLKAVLEGRK